MNKDEVGMIGFEIVAYAGEARSKLLDALNKAKMATLTKLRDLAEAKKG